MLRYRVSLIAFASTLALAACATAPAPIAETDNSSLLMGDYLAGRYADMTNDPGVASERYLSALKRAPNDPVLLSGAIESALIAGDMARAEDAAQLARAQGADVVLGRLTLASAALKAGHTATVRTLVEGTDGPPFDRLAARVLRAWSFAGEGKTDLALTALGEISDSAPFARVFDYQRALILQRAGRDGDALKAYESAMRNGLRIPPAIIQHGALLERMGKKDTALSLYEAVLVGGEEPLLTAALERARKGEPTLAPSLDPPSEGAAIGFYSLAALLAGQTDADFYLPYLTLALALDPDLDNARLVYAGGLAETQQYDAARRALGAIATSSPFYERAQVQLMLLLRQQGDNDAALALARAAVAQTKGRLSRLALADLLRSLDKYGDAEPLYDGLVRDDPASDKEAWRLYFARGACRERLGRWGEAEIDLKKALELSPEQPEVMNYLGYSWVDQGSNLQQGMKLIERAVAAEPDSGYIVDSLGWAYFKLGDYKKAIDNLERAVELSPEDPILNDHLGDAYWRGGRRTEARYQWDRSISLKPTEADAALTKAKLAKGLPAEPARRTARSEDRH